MHHQNTDGLTSSPRDWYCRAKYQNVQNSSAWIKLILVFSCIIFKPKLTTSHLRHGFRMFILSIIAPNVVQKLLPSFGFSFSSGISWDMRLDYLQDVQTALWPLCISLLMNVWLYLLGWSTGSLHLQHFSFCFGVYLVFCFLHENEYYSDGFKIIMLA